MKKPHRPTKQEIRSALNISMGEWSFKGSEELRNAEENLERQREHALAGHKGFQAALALERTLSKKHRKGVKKLQEEHDKLTGEFLTKGPTVALARKIVAFQKKVRAAR